MTPLIIVEGSRFFFSVCSHRPAKLTVFMTTAAVVIYVRSGLLIEFRRWPASTKESLEWDSYVWTLLYQDQVNKRLLIYVQHTMAEGYEWESPARRFVKAEITFRPLPFDVRLCLSTSIH